MSSGRTWEKWCLTPFLPLLFFAPFPALAQDAAGKFTLTKEVRWGSAVLPAGDYQYSLEHRAGALLLLRHSGAGKAR